MAQQGDEEWEAINLDPSAPAGSHLCERSVYSSVNTQNLYPDRKVTHTSNKGNRETESPNHTLFMACNQKSNAQQHHLTSKLTTIS